MPAYVILGTSHDIQWKGGAPDARTRALNDGLCACIRELVSEHKIALIAEEAPHRCPTVAGNVAQSKGIPYVQIDMSPQQLDAASIRTEMDRRYELASEQDANAEPRCRRADDLRENFWLDRIEAANASPVLVVCGWAHTRFLAEKVLNRNCQVAEEVFFPACLGDRRIILLP